MRHMKPVRLILRVNLITNFIMQLYGLIKNDFVFSPIKVFYWTYQIMIMLLYVYSEVKYSPILVRIIL